MKYKKQNRNSISRNISESDLYLLKNMMVALLYAINCFIS